MDVAVQPPSRIPVPPAKPSYCTLQCTSYTATGLTVYDQLILGQLRPNAGVSQGNMLSAERVLTHLSDP